MRLERKKYFRVWCFGPMKTQYETMLHINYSIFKGRISKSSDSEANFWYSSSLVERILKEERLTGAYGKIPGTELYLHMDSIRFKRGNDELVFDYAFETEDPMTYRSIRGFFWFYPQDIIERAMTQIAGDLFNLHLGGELHHRMTNLPDETVELLRAIVLCEYIGKQDRKFYVTSTWSKRPDIVSELLKLRSICFIGKNNYMTMKGEQNDREEISRC